MPYEDFGRKFIATAAATAALSGAALAQAPQHATEQKAETKKVTFAKGEFPEHFEKALQGIREELIESEEVHISTDTEEIAILQNKNLFEKRCRQINDRIRGKSCRIPRRSDSASCYLYRRKERE